MINLPGCIVLPTGDAKVFQIRKIQRLKLFTMTQYIVLVTLYINNIVNIIHFDQNTVWCHWK